MSSVCPRRSSDLSWRSTEADIPTASQVGMEKDGLFLKHHGIDEQQRRFLYRKISLQEYYPPLALTLRPFHRKTPSLNEGGITTFFHPMASILCLLHLNPNIPTPNADKGNPSQIVDHRILPPPHSPSLPATVLYRPRVTQYVDRVLRTQCLSPFSPFSSSSSFLPPTTPSTLSFNAPTTAPTTLPTNPNPNDQPLTLTV